ncbi:MAG: hypothetical protein GX100_13760 [candidate division WS1 bacterium]|jgi:hypothetical protein|nr:hypothetical protein [candidate division WS1 bacterium]
MVSPLIFVGAMVLLLLAVATSLLVLNSANQRLAEAHGVIEELQAKLEESAKDKTPELVEAQRGRLKRATQFISAYLDPYFGLPGHQIEDRLVAVAQEVRLPDEPETLADLAEGLALLVRVTPQIAMHTRNYNLLGHLWARAAGGSFVYLCGRLALALPSHDDMATRWRENQMTWNQLLDDLRVLELRDALSPRTQPDGVQGPEEPAL